MGAKLDRLPRNSPSAARSRPQKVDEITYIEYGGVYPELAQRNRWKAYWLTLSYCAFFLALASSALTTVYIVLKFKVPPAAPPR